MKKVILPLLLIVSLTTIEAASIERAPQNKKIAASAAAKAAAIGQRVKKHSEFEQIN